MNLPKNLKYNKDFSWIKIDKDIATIGVIDPKIKNIKEFVFVMLPKKGKKIKKGEKYVTLEAVKWTGNLLCPVSGEIIEVNEEVYDEPSKINQDSYKNWLIKIKMSNTDEVKELFDAKDVKSWIKEKS